MGMQELETTARALLAPGKGILAMDESTPTIGKRLQAADVENTEENRIAYREMLLGTPGLGDYISGTILYDETIRQSISDGTPFPALIQKQGIVPGIKVDAGAKPLALHPDEKITEGLDGLRERLAEYRDLGARFAKWRAVITIGSEIPSRACIEANAHALARYAALCQERGIVPIVEPEVLMDGGHGIDQCYATTHDTVHTVFEELYRQGVSFQGMILKASMVLSGKDNPEQAGPEQVAAQTIHLLRNTVPASVPGIAFLSGGQSDELATLHLNTMNEMTKDMKLPWRLTFSYARALQHPALMRWRGEPGNVEAARKLLLHRARCNAAASVGEYSTQMEQEEAA